MRIAGEMSHVAMEEHLQYLELHPFGRFPDIGTASPATSIDCKEATKNPRVAKD